ncbi:MAG TPA: phosphotransferase family protein [Dehalococcoidia bacterium]|nr:phosphotransferase family protein [Dehalococcoidia bacterium]
MSEQVPGLNLDALLPWFRANIAPVDSLSARIIGHGRSNITYRLEADGQRWVLRRPPLSHVLPTAHDMRREFRILSALKDTDVPVPRPIAYCEDPGVNDRPFYVMEYVEGLVPADRAEVERRFDEAQRRRIGEQLVDILVSLHSLDYNQIGLGDFGRPEGYIARQVRRFSEQLQQIRKRDIPELDELARRLAASLPESTDASIVHGDYRLDNAILSDDGRIVAVLDWEMSTLGDPLADVGLLMMYWPERDAAGDGPGAVVGSTSVMTLPGFPTRSEAVARYAARSGRTLDHVDFYTVLAHFKLAVILENMHQRFLAGGTVGAGFETIGDQVIVLARAGLAIADRSSIRALRGS